MSSKDLANVVKRAIGDAAFRRQLQSDPKGALKGFDLTSQESAAISSGDPTKLSALGVDQRMSKAFAIGDATVARASFGSDATGTASGSVAGSDESSAAARAFGRADDSSTRGGMARESDPAVSGARVDDAATGTSGDAVITSDEWATGGAMVSPPLETGESGAPDTGAAATRGASLVDNAPYGTGVGTTASLQDNAPYGTGAGTETAGGAPGDAFLTEQEWPTGASGAVSGTGDIDKGASLVDNPPFDASAESSDDTAAGSGEPSNYP